MSKKSERIRRRDLYLRAADLIANGKETYSCYSVTRAKFPNKDRNKFYSVDLPFAKNDKDRILYWGSFSVDEYELQRNIEGPYENDPQEIRILLLCMMAAMVETGDA